MRKLRKEGVIYNPLSYWRNDDSEEAEQIVNEYEAPHLTILELCELLSATRLADAEDITHKNKRVKILLAMIKNRLEIPEIDYLVDIIDEIFTEIGDDMEKWNRYKNHRHITFGAGYSEKAVY